MKSIISNCITNTIYCRVPVRQEIIWAIPVNCCDVIRTVTYAYTQKYIQLLGLVYAGWRGVHLQSHLLQHPPHRAGDGEEEEEASCCVPAVIMRVWSTPPPTPGPPLATHSWRGRGELARPLILDCGGRRKQYWWRKWGILQWVPVFESFTMMYIISQYSEKSLVTAGYVHDCTVLQAADGPEVWLLVIVATYK